MKKVLCITATAAVLDLGAMNLADIDAKTNASVNTVVSPLTKETNAKTSAPHINEQVAQLVVPLPEDAYNEILAAEEAVRIKKENYDNARAKHNVACAKWNEQPTKIKELTNKENRLNEEADELQKKREELEAKIKELEETQDKSIPNSASS
ncbi:hypothetical protein FACS1894122_10110 [Alphaproteobacteria bacterium]|nr:hypothetical protein FACS1894122_10110 [Alphaproteobacteria bacterium]